VTRFPREGDRVETPDGPGVLTTLDVVKWFNRIRLKTERQAVARVLLDDGSTRSFSPSDVVLSTSNEGGSP